jgi:hypothetical protein
MSTWRLPRVGGQQGRKDICDVLHVAVQISAPPIGCPRPRERTPAFPTSPPPRARSTNARRRCGRGGGGATAGGAAVDSLQRGGGTGSVSSSVAQVYIGSSAVDSARLIVTHGGRLRGAIDSLHSFPFAEKKRELSCSGRKEDEESGQPGTRIERVRHGFGRRLEPCLVYPHGNN